MQKKEKKGRKIRPISSEKSSTRISPEIKEILKLFKKEITPGRNQDRQKNQEWWKYRNVKQYKRCFGNNFDFFRI